MPRTAKKNATFDRRKHLHEVAQHDDVLRDELNRHKALRIFALVGMLVLAGWIIVALVEPTPAYRLLSPGTAPVDDQQFILDLEGVTGARLLGNSRVEPFYNGESFYPAEIATMRSAQHSIDLEAYIFKDGEIARQAVAAMADRARAGVKVDVVIDAMGSSGTGNGVFKPLTDAGGRVHRYHRLRWDNWYRFNNRTHRELLVVDGKIAFLGGAGYADYWYKDVKKEKRWRDNMFRVDGDAVNALQSVFVDNWLETSGEIIDGPNYFPPADDVHGERAMVVGSSPSVGGSTNARILFQTLIGSAQKSIDIANPYFLPDAGLKDALVKAAHDRGVRVRILTVGEKTDHKMVRADSRKNYGELLKAGAQVYEYQPGMIHEKIMVIDGAWVVVGSANMDTRSFGLNDEVNVAALDRNLAANMTGQFEKDLSQARAITLREWERRGPIERAEALFGWFWVRQQ